MPKIVSLFNHKGGVSKTTTTFNLGWALAAQGKRVLVVDADPQCNLTGMVLSFHGGTDFEQFYAKHPKANLCAALGPAFGGGPSVLAAADVQTTAQKGLSLLAGHIDLAEYEAQLAIAFTASASLPVMKNLPGAVGNLLRKTAAERDVDAVLVDMSPSIGALNQSIFLCSDYFIVPTSPDYFCFLAINSLAKVLPRWNKAASHLRASNDLAYPLPANGPRFLGIISQRYRPRSGAPAAAFQTWIDRLKKAVADTLAPALASEDMIVAEAALVAAGAPDPYNLANVADFNSLIAQSHTHSTPVFALTDAQIERVGYVLDTMRKSRDDFRTVFENLAKTVVSLTGI